MNSKPDPALVALAARLGFTVEQTTAYLLSAAVAALSEEKFINWPIRFEQVME